MPSTRDLLQRFRPAGAPGAATSTGVPADRIEEREAELAPVFHLLEDTVAESARIRQDAAAEAALRRQRAREEAAARIAGARLDADTIRAQVLAQAQQEATTTAGVSAEAAREAAEAIGADFHRGLEADVAEVVARVRVALAPTSERYPP